MSEKWGSTLPSDYRDLLDLFDGGEGYLGESFIRIYSIEQVLYLDANCGVQDWCPGHLIIGSNGAGAAFLLAPDGGVVELPFIPMLLGDAERRADSVARFLCRDAASPHAPDSRFAGKEIHEIQPLVFGGDPTDFANKLALTLQEYAPLVLWWNRLYRELSAQAG